MKKRAVFMFLMIGLLLTGCVPRWFSSGIRDAFRVEQTPDIKRNILPFNTSEDILPEMTYKSYSSAIAQLFEEFTDADWSSSPGAVKENHYKLTPGTDNEGYVSYNRFVGEQKVSITYSFKENKLDSMRLNFDPNSLSKGEKD